MPEDGSDLVRVDPEVDAPDGRRRLLAEEGAEGLLDVLDHDGLGVGKAGGHGLNVGTLEAARGRRGCSRKLDRSKNKQETIIRFSKGIICQHQSKRKFVLYTSFWLDLSNFFPLVSSRF